MESEGAIRRGGITSRWIPVKYSNNRSYGAPSEKPISLALRNDSNHRSRITGREGLGLKSSEAVHWRSHW